MFGLFQYTPAEEKTQPILNLVELEKLCKDLSDAYHWDVTISSDGGVNYVYKNGTMAYAFCDETYIKDTPGILRAVERTIRSNG